MTHETVRYEKKIELRHEVDVFVAGGGPGGIAAAVAAARHGSRVFLAEGHSCLGGMGTAGLVPAFMSFSDGVNRVVSGIGDEIIARCEKERAGDFIDSYKIRAEVLKRVYDDMLTEAGVDFTLHTQLIDVAADKNRVDHAIIASKSGIFAVKAKIYIDATGDGDLAAWAGASFKIGDENGDMMPGTLCSLWADIDWERVSTAGQNPREKLPVAFGDKVFTFDDSHLPGIWQVGRHAGGGNIGHTFGVDATDERSLTKALIWGRKSMLEYGKFYREYVKNGYENMELVATGSLLGVRESRRITGDYVLNVEDFKARAVFDDEIGRYCYPVDIHPTRPDRASFEKFEKEFRQDLRYKKGETYGIPYRVLCPVGLSNVLVTGRCVSCDRAILGSIRVMPGCYITGQAAGIAAAIAAERKTHIRGFAVRELQARLKRAGAYLPNFSEEN